MLPKAAEGHVVQLDGKESEAIAAVPRWSFITVSYNSADALKTYWGSATIPAGAEWIVVDNSSSDATVSIAESLGARVIRLEVNLGFGAANNIGMNQSRGEFIAFVNPDVTVDFSTLPALERVVQSLGGVIGPQLINPDGSLQPNGRGIATLPSKIRNRLKSETGTSGYQRTAEPGEQIAVDWLIGAAVIATRQTFDKFGAWDDHFFVYYEDSDLGMRAWKHGVPVHVLGDVRWIHGWARETTSFNVDAWKRELTSMAKFYSRYPALLGPIRMARWAHPYSNPTTRAANGEQFEGTISNRNESAA
ncbi:glycosyltransferase family 2 protein [Leifsonia kafniensis]|uniref:Glycosyltransferase family 2 protein n=1 Tax=Leifsonia kafniensis TaxID=475957 RepID=A0ABP7L715_9MICO